MTELLESENRIESQRQSPSHSVPPQKKTRDLPNLNECHACGFKVDVCTGKNRLRILYSEWRVVLLCNKCFSSVESSQICSYCLSGASPECFRCIQCRHSVHQSCFLKYKDVAPWSYSYLGSQFSICVDCWIPKPVAISRSRRKKEIFKRKGRVVVEKGVSTVLEAGNLVRSMEDVVRDANRAVEEKTEAAARAREEAVKKAEVARRAIDLANNALSLVANKENTSLKLPPIMDPVKVVDGSELTFVLHPDSNGAPRISETCCLLNTSCLDVPERLASGVDSSCKTSSSRNTSGCDGMHEVFNDIHQYENTHKSLCEPSVSLRSVDTDSSNDLNCLCLGRSGMKTSRKDDECTAAFDVDVIGDELLKEGEGSCFDRLMNFNVEDSGMEHDRKQKDYAIHREKQCGGQRSDRYILKYSRRHSLKLNLDR